MKNHNSWRVRSICPHCNKLNERRVPVGERVIMIYCDHCPHGYEYIHIVQNPVLVEDVK